MNIPDFRVEPANYRADHDDLLIIFNVNKKPDDAPDSAADSINPLSIYVIARDNQHQPIGAGELTSVGTIEGLAVTPKWHNQGVELALLTALIDKAAKSGLTEIKAQAIESHKALFEGLNFRAVTQNEPGIYSLSMTPAPVSQPSSRPNPKPAPESIEPVKMESLMAIMEASIQLISSARRQICIISKDLEWPLYAQSAMIEALKSFAIDNRNSLVMILIQDPSALNGRSHPLIDLAQRLPSSIQLRTPTEMEDIGYPSALLLSDQRGYLFRLNNDQAKGDWSPCLPSRTKQLAELFERLWQCARPCTEFRALNL
ncbi:GNAT family N-acetyltransferase [Methylicorpusculum sp.]|uniref:GNAT family N-acetyltransferase n=1 Tax=Methylicorpusculum sp. TaxID=2713644 RepID=UPI00272F5737|nr:GNAT family N-acetyltransferase [Methylicorpusculum sp.]MDP2176936.1 GNAT family N-acetyltransferase [Methylicorpusculum sp.]MDP3528706.1 GNAT family N-acetyltransferase [Methylicorpusculum sp.]MDZ4153429.1 GNAT family N-acetyltransferase [Methylicorpusculum sp.]